MNDGSIQFEAYYATRIERSLAFHRERTKRPGVGVLSDMIASLHRRNMYCGLLREAHSNDPNYRSIVGKRAWCT